MLSVKQHHERVRKIQLFVLVQHKTDIIIVSSNKTCSRYVKCGVNRTQGLSVIFFFLCCNLDSPHNGRTNIIAIAILSSFMSYYFVTRVIPQVPHVEQELFTLPEHLSSPADFSGIRYARSLVFCVMFCRQLFDLFLLAIVLSVHLQFTTSDYPFGINFS